MTRHASKKADLEKFAASFKSESSAARLELVPRERLGDLSILSVGGRLHQGPKLSCPAFAAKIPPKAH